MMNRRRNLLLIIPVLFAVVLFSPIPGTAAQDPNEAKAREAAGKQRQDAMELLKHQIEVLAVERMKRAERNRQLRDEIIQRCELSPENVTAVLLGLERDAFKLQMEGPPKGIRLDTLRKMISEMDAKSKVDPHNAANATGRLLLQVQDLALEVAESEARLELTKRKIKELRAVQSFVDEYMLYSTHESPRLDKALDTAESQLLQLRLGK